MDDELWRLLCENNQPSLAITFEVAYNDDLCFNQFRIVSTKKQSLTCAMFDIIGTAERSDPRVQLYLFSLYFYFLTQCQNLEHISAHLSIEDSWLRRCEALLVSPSSRWFLPPPTTWSLSPRRTLVHGADNGVLLSPRRTPVHGADNGCTR